MLPVLSARDLKPIRARSDNPHAAWKDAKFFTSGRIALASALAELGISAGCEVLMPAYHCLSMIAPVRWNGAEAVYYRIHRNLAPDLDDILSKISGKTRALLAVHFFGFATDLSELRAICNHHQVALIEDCAHVMIPGRSPEGVGSAGDLVIASPRKFFPIQDGGILSSNGRCIDHMRPKSVGLRYELKIAFNTVENSVKYGRLGIASWVVQSMSRKGGENQSGREAERLKEAGREERLSEHRQDASQSSGAPRRAPLNSGMSVASRAILRNVSVSESIRLRIRNYTILKEHLSPLSRPEMADTPAGCLVIPYVYTMEIADPERTHRTLRQENVPVWRWDSLASSDCKISNELSLSLIQLPCHQSLSDGELDLLIARVKKVLRK